MLIGTERKVVEQICDLLGIPKSSNDEKVLRAIRNETFKNLRKGAGADWGDPNDFKEDRSWVEEMLSEDAEAKTLFEEYCEEHKKRNSRLRR